MVAPIAPIAPPLPKDASPGGGGFEYFCADDWQRLAKKARGSTAESQEALQELGRAFREQSLVKQFELVLKASAVPRGDPMWLLLELFSIAYGTQTSVLAAHCDALGKHTQALSTLTELNGRYATCLAGCLSDLEQLYGEMRNRLQAGDHIVEATGLILGRLERLVSPASRNFGRLLIYVGVALQLITVGALFWKLYL